MPQVRPADLDEHHPEPVRDVLHERRLAISGRRDEQQQPLRVGAPVGVGGAELLGEAVTDQRQVHLVQQPVADERRHHARPVVVQPQPPTLGGHQGGAQPLVRTEGGHGMRTEFPGTRQEFIDAYGEGSAAPDARVVPEEPLDPLRERRVAPVPRQLRAELHRHGLREIAVGGCGAGGLRVRDEPALHELLPGGQVIAEGGEVVRVRVGPGGPVERVQESADRGTHDEPVGPAGQLLEEVGGYGIGPGRIPEPGDLRCPLLLKHGDGRGEPERVTGTGQGGGPPGPRDTLRLLRPVRPEELGRRPDGGLVAQQPRVRVQAQQGAQDGGGVLVVDAPGVPLVVGFGRRLAYEQGEFGVVQRGERLGPPLLQQPGRQILAPVDGGRLRGEKLLPVRAGRLERRVGDWSPVVGPGQCEREPLPGGHERQVERLGVDGEPVPPELDHGPAVRVQLAAVPQRPPGLLAGRLQPSVQLLRPYGIAQFTQLVGGTPNLGDHRVGGEVRVDGVQIRERGHAPADGLQHPLRRPGQPLGPPRPLVLERLLTGRERVVHLTPPLGQLGEEVVELREPRLQVLQLEQQPRELVVTGLR